MAGGGGTSGPSVVRAAMVRFALLSLLSGLVVTLGAVVAADQFARARAVTDARTRAVNLTERLAAPLVDGAVREGVPGAADQLTRVLTNRMRDGSVTHLRLWSEDGRVIWADEPELIGRTTSPVPENMAALFGTHDTYAGGTELSGVMVGGEETESLEVYVGAFDADGEPLVAEIYLPADAMEADARALLFAIVPLILAAVGLVLLAVLPLALSLGRRVEWALSERSAMMQHALRASELERRRVAEDLHHGVVQELTGVGYTLPVVTRQLEPGGDLEAARSTLEMVTGLVQRNVQALRSLMTDVYPPDLRDEGLREAVQQMVRTATNDAGLRARVDIEEDLDLPLDAAHLAYRVIREGVRNVVKHAQAEGVVVELRTEAGQVVAGVEDDGLGPGDEPWVSPQGHLGLRLLADTVRDAGGRLQIDPREGGGTRLVARFPPVGGDA